MFNENGQKQLEQNYLDGKKNGLRTYWDENGVKIGEEFYKNGQEVKNNKNKTPERPPVVQEIINRCRTQMGEYGAAMVKACVDRDIEAEKALQKY